MKNAGMLTKKTPKTVVLYLGLIVLFWAFCFVTLKLWLMPCSIAYSETDKITAGYLLYAAIGILISTPAPFLSVLILALSVEKIGIKEFFARIFRAENKKTALLTIGFCIFPLLFALLRGTRNGEPWYLLPLGFLVMLPFVGIAEETGWRGFLGPALEERLPFPVATLLTGAVWYVWHFDLWLDPTSNHYGDSLLGFGITIFIWAFALSALYRVTGSVIACAVYHAMIDAIGAIYDWNSLFDAFPGDVFVNVYRALWLGLSIAVWLLAEKKDRRSIEEGALL